MITTVLDPNVIVSAAITPRGAPARIFEEWQEGAIDLVVCPTLLREVREVLARPRISRYIDRSDAERLLDLIERSATVLPDPSAIAPVSRDPDDDYLFALALEAGAVFVSGDDDVLAVGSVGVRVLRPAAFLQVILGPGSAR